MLQCQTVLKATHEIKGKEYSRTDVIKIHCLTVLLLQRWTTRLSMEITCRCVRLATQKLSLLNFFGRQVDLWDTTENIMIQEKINLFSVCVNSLGTNDGKNGRSQILKSVSIALESLCKEKQSLSHMLSRTYSSLSVCASLLQQ